MGSTWPIELKCGRSANRQFNSLSADPLIKFMFESLKKAGCPIDKTRIVCVDCDEKRTGGYSPELGVSWRNGFSFARTHSSL